MRITSSDTRAALELADFDGESLAVSIRASDHQASLRVHAWSPYGSGHDLGELFEELGKSWTGWKGSKAWRSVEGELSLAVRHDGIGTVSFEVCLNPRANGGPPWTLTSELHVDPGALGAIAEEARRFFEQTG